MLVGIKLLHKVFWLFFVECILAIPVVGFHHQFLWWAVLTVLVLAECAVIGLNHFRCPLTDLACRYTKDRADNFDIYLPLWSARHNKAIFGTLFVVEELWHVDHFLTLGPR
ncbi:MAG TPA: hypothetical protein VEU96_00890 [Bryobacteraceae bacterium]|nr:hypothetical protein [Bryobacteraceae bacterium]